MLTNSVTLSDLLMYLLIQTWLLSLSLFCIFLKELNFIFHSAIMSFDNGPCTNSLHSESAQTSLSTPSFYAFQSLFHLLVGMPNFSVSQLIKTCSMTHDRKGTQSIRNLDIVYHFPLGSFIHICLNRFSFEF